MDIFLYTAKHNPQGAVDVIKKFGYNYNPVSEWEKNAELLKLLVNKHGEQALDEIGKIHPDRDLVVNNNKKESHANCDACDSNLNCNACSEHTNCSGCGGKCGKATKPLNFAGEVNNMIMPVTQTKENTPTNEKTHVSISKETLAVIALFSVIGIIIINFKK